MDLLQSFKKTVQRHQLFDKSDQLLLAVSGGADSVAMCHICNELGYRFGIAHINYQLRGRDSDDDASFVEALASKLNVDVHIKAIDCKQYAEANDLAIQEAARNIRYDFFEAIQAMHSYDYVLTAHHAKDNVETMLYTLAKGASLGALRGIPVQRDKIVRPLLHTTKSAIDIYLRSKDIRHRHDISNDDTKYNRNYIRHEILPRLEQINPSIESTLVNTAILGSSYQDLVSKLLLDQKSQFRKSNKLDLSTMIKDTSRYAWLYEMIHPLGFNFNDALDIWKTIDQKHSTGKTFQVADHILTLDRGSILLNNAIDDVEYEPLQIENINADNKRIRIEQLDKLSEDKGIYLDSSKIKFPLTLRRWQAGDRFRPSGMNGKSKKIKDYLTDQKISGDARTKVEVLIAENEIIWVVGHRLAHGYKANSESKSILSITIK